MISSYLAGEYHPLSPHASLPSSAMPYYAFPSPLLSLLAPAVSAARRHRIRHHRTASAITVGLAAVKSTTAAGLAPNGH